MATAREVVVYNLKAISNNLDFSPNNIPNILATPARMKAVLFEVYEKMTKADREDTSLMIPIMTAARRGSKLIWALSRNGAV